MSISVKQLPLLSAQSQPTYLVSIACFYRSTPISNGHCKHDHLNKTKNNPSSNF